MPKLVIDGVEVVVPEGTNVLEAAKAVGITIPHFCYHPALGSVGACRLCAMTFLEGPVKGVQVSCMVKAADGMVVSTTDGEAARLRRMVIEWLMLNHPHDCPVCDEGGQCRLQDYTIAGGHGIRRYKGPKRTFTDQYLGEYIQQEMNRCIHCYRCARFYQDYAGGTDFGPQRLANKTFFGRVKDGPLESPFSGNLADVCPTGVFTDKTYRYKARPWDLETAPSICPHCPLGCNTTVGGRYRELLRVTARVNLKVNGWFICDRGRYGHIKEERIYYPVVDGEAVSKEDAVVAAAARLRDVVSRHGAGAVAFVGSSRASLENLHAMRSLAALIGTDAICYSPDPARERMDRLAVARMYGLKVRSMMELAGSDVIICIGADPINDGPMAALLMRQAARNGAKIHVIGTEPVELPFEYTLTPCPSPASGRGVKEELADALWDTPTPSPSPAGGEGGKGNKKLTIVVGPGGGNELIDRAADEAARLSAAGTDCGIFYFLASANSYGVAVLADNGPDFEDVLAGIEAGRVKAVVAVESDPLGECPDTERVKAAFSKLEMLVALDYRSTETTCAAGVILPVRSTAESDGIFINNEGRAQAFARAYESGFPINRMGPAVYPPREFHTEIPGHTEPSWRVLGWLAAAVSPGCETFDSISGIRAAIVRDYPSLANIEAIEAGTEGVRLL